MPRLAFKITDKDTVRQIPDCIGATQMSNRNRGPVHDLWDKAIEFELSRERVQWALGLAILTAAGPSGSACNLGSWLVTSSRRYCKRLSLRSGSSRTWAS